MIYHPSMPHNKNSKKEKISSAMARALSPFFSTSLHYNERPQTQFPVIAPISLRLSPPPRQHQVTLTARAKFGKFDGSDVATSNTNGGDQQIK
jgi:hypothetical protein